MGRVFEKRKHKMFARFDRMAKAFSRIGKEISMAVKQNGPNPDSNPRLRAAMLSAKGVNMPKERVDAAIKRAVSKDTNDYEEVVFEGYGPHGVAILCECATDNNNRTVASIRSYFTRGGGALGKTGSLDFIFTQKGIFKLKAAGLDPDDLELELIDHGLEELYTDEEEGQIIIHTAFVDFARMQRALEALKVDVLSAELERVPQSLIEVSEQFQEEVLELVEKIEEDEDVQRIFHNMK
jgi:YebC/PmpR family DNA-binding regulatory protein